MSEEKQVSVVGGAGHIGLPLSCFLQNRGLTVKIIDKNLQSIGDIAKGESSFFEAGLDINLKKALENGLAFSSEINQISLSKFVFITIGTSSSQESIDLFRSLARDVVDHMKPDCYLILRSTITNEDIEELKSYKKFKEKKIKLSYCPERIAEGEAFKELELLPQIVGTDSEHVYEEVNKFFDELNIKTINTSFENAVFIKLFSNAYRHANFSIINEFFNIAHINNIDFSSIKNIASTDYPRLSNIPSTGYVGGPCLPKDLDTFVRSYVDRDSS